MKEILDVSSPSTVQEAVSVLKRDPNAIPWAGGSYLALQAEAEPGASPGVPRGVPQGVSIIDLGNISELKGISRTSNYIEIGALSTLNEILALPGGIGIGLLKDACLGIGTGFTRNMATIGGNLAVSDRFMSTIAALYCLDASIEIREHGSSRWYGLNRLIDEMGRPRKQEPMILSRIRIPGNSWTTWATRPIGPHLYPHPSSANFAAAIRFEKNTITELRMAGAGMFFLRDRTVELSFVGKKLPFTAKDFDECREAYIARANEQNINMEFTDSFISLACRFLELAPEEIL